MVLASFSIRCIDDWLRLRLRNPLSIAVGAAKVQLAAVSDADNQHSGDVNTYHSCRLRAFKSYTEICPGWICAEFWRDSPGRRCGVPRSWPPDEPVAVFPSRTMTVRHLLRAKMSSRGEHCGVRNGPLAIAQVDRIVAGQIVLPRHSHQALLVQPAPVHSRRTVEVVAAGIIGQ